MNQRYRKTNIEKSLNALKVVSLKTLKAGLNGKDKTIEQLLSANIVLELCRQYEPVVWMPY